MNHVKVTKYDEGPFVIQGDFEIVDGEGATFAKTETVALCRCGRSGTQPFCDGSHKAAGYREASRAR